MKHFLFFRDSECSQVEKKIKRNKVKKKDGVHSAKAKRSRFKTSQKKDSVAKDDTKMAVYGEKADNRSLESALMKKKNQPISSKNLLKLLKHPCPSEITLTNWRFMFQDIFKTLNLERVIGLLCLAIMDRHG